MLDPHGNPIFPTAGVSWVQQIRTANKVGFRREQPGSPRHLPCRSHRTPGRSCDEAAQSQKTAVGTFLISAKVFIIDTMSDLGDIRNISNIFLITNNIRNNFCVKFKTRQAGPYLSIFVLRSEGHCALQRNGRAMRGCSIISASPISRWMK